MEGKKRNLLFQIMGPTRWTCFKALNHVAREHPPSADSASPAYAAFSGRPISGQESWVPSVHSLQPVVRKAQRLFLTFPDLIKDSDYRREFGVFCHRGPPVHPSGH